jgi:flagellar basal-body rod protein FlgC
VSGDPSKVYKPRHPIFEAVRASLQNSAGPQGLSTGNGDAAVRVRGIYESPAPPAARYEPGNPLANEQGYVYAPAVNAVEEMVNMISASRSYQNNVEVMNTARNLLLKTLQMGQS